MTRNRLLAPAVLTLGTLGILIAVMLGATPRHGHYLSPVDIQQTDNPGGDSPWAGQPVDVEGVVTAVSPHDLFYYISDPKGGAWSGVKVMGPSLDRTVGELVFVVGTVEEYFGETRVIEQAVSGRGPAELPKPAEIGVADLLGNGEKWEGSLVRLRNLVIASGTDRHGEFLIHDDTGFNGEVDDEFLYSYIADPSDTFESMTGVVAFGWGDFQLEPRSDRDLAGYVSARPNDASVVVSVTNGRGDFLPCRLTFTPASGEALELGPDDRASGSEDVAYVWRERQTVPLPAGTYDVVISRGLEYGIDRRRISVGPGGETFLSAVLKREVDTRGWISGDFHLHASPSSDTPLPVAGRIQSLAGEGVEWAISTDHNVVTDYMPIIREQGLQNWMTSSVGDEITTRSPSFGHFNAWPLETGAPPPYAGQSPASLFAGARADLGVEVVQVNHPIIPAWGNQYYQIYAVNQFTGDPETPGFSFDFDALEVYNGGFLDDGDRNFEIWMRQLNNGHRITATGNSDSHHLVYREPGYPRNFVASSTDSPNDVSEDELVAAVLAGRSYLTYGPVVDLRINGGGLGDLVVPDETGALEIGARIQTASWLDVDEAQLYSNGRLVGTIPLTSQGGGPQEYTVQWTDRPEADSWYLLRVDGSGDLEPVRRGSWFRPLAVTNPIYADVDGNGTFDPPGNVADEVSIVELDAVDASGVPLRIGDWVAITGCATTGTRYTDPNLGLFYVDDGTGGIQVREKIGNVTEVRRGDEVWVGGFVTQSFGETHLTECRVEIRGNAAACREPELWTTGAVAAGPEAEEGVAVRLDGVNVVSGSWPANGNEGAVVLDDGSGPVTLLIPRGVIVPAEASMLHDFVFTALVTQRDFSSPYDSGYRLSLRDGADLFGGPASAATGVGLNGVEAALRFGVPRPNPFRDALRIPLFGRSRGETPRVEVLDVTGRRIRSLSAERAGATEIRWDGRDSGGKQVAAGVYYLRLTGAADAGTRKIVKLQ